MAESVIKMKRKINGVKDYRTYQSRKEPANAGTNGGPRAVRDQILDDAQKIKQLEDRVFILENELQRAREDSFKAGYDEGKQNTLQDAQNRIEAVRLEMKQQEIQFRETIEQLERPLLNLAKEIAKEVIGKEIQQSDETDFILLERLRKMLYEVVEQNNIIIEVNPVHLSMMKQNNLNEKIGLSDQSQVKVLGNENIGKGEAKISTEDYFIDGTFDNHVDKLHDQLNKGNKK